MSHRADRIVAIKTTKHAEVRLRQRGIPWTVVDWLICYGTARHDHHGGMLFYFDSRSRTRLQSELERTKLARYSEHLACYVVVSNTGKVITVGRRLGRFRFR
jgi:hypothetical protein